MTPNQLVSSPNDDDISAFKDKQSNIWTSIPAIILSFDPLTMTASVQPAIQGIWYTPIDGNNVGKFINLPQLIYCPVQFPGAGGTSITFPIKLGDECLVIFSSRCIDGWYQNGAFDHTKQQIIPRPQLELRLHDMSDGMCLLGFKSVPNVFPNISTSTLQIRNNVSSTESYCYIEVDPTTNNVNVHTSGSVNITTAGTVNINSTGNTNITAPTVAITGNMTVSGSITAQV